jgi:uncharacterized protein (DUF342 family)
MIEKNIPLNSLDIKEIIAPLCEIHIHKDAMKVSLWLRKNAQGECASLADIKNELLRQGITFGVVSDNILEKLIVACPVNNIIIAEGIYPIDGHDSVRVSLLPDINRGTPMVNDEDDIVDYRELGDILVVNAGEPLLKLSEPTQGKAGKNVFGEIVEQQPGKNIPLVSNSDSTYVDPENPKQLLSAIAGQPVLTEDGAYVTPILELDSIDLSTGNIRFNGSIIVKNNIESGMKVYAAKDIMVEGSILNSRIECLGDVLVKKGVFGNSVIIANGNVDIKQGVQGNPISDVLATSSRIVASGVLTKFAENVVIEVDNNLVIEKYAMNCKLMAEKISVGTKDLSGSIIGGLAWATRFIKVPILGNESGGSVTELRTGVNPQLQSAIEELLLLLEINEEKQRNVFNTLEYFKEQDLTPELQNKIEQLNFIFYELKSEADAYQQEIQMLKAEIKYPDNPKIVISRKINFGVAIQIRKTFWKARKEVTGETIFTLDTFGQIEISRASSRWFK